MVRLGMGRGRIRSYSTHHIQIPFLGLIWLQRTTWIGASNIMQVQVQVQVDPLNLQGLTLGKHPAHHAE